MFSTDMKQVTLFLFLNFVALTLGTREFKKSYIAEFNPRWPTLRAQSAVCIRTILLQKDITSVFLAVMQHVLL